MNTALRRLPSRVQLDGYKAGASLISPHISFSLRTAWASASPVPLFHFPVRSLTTSQYQPFEYHWIEDVERLELYMQGGYHPVRINDKLHDRYLIVDKLGSGGYSTIWLAQDQRLNRYVALKVIIAQASSLHPTRESSILRKLSEVSLPSPKAYSMSMVSEGRDAITSILDEFTIQGPNCIHSCYAMSPAQGSLMEASANRLFPIQVCRILAAKLVLAVSYVHSRGVVHGDIHLRNMLVKMSASFDELTIDQFRTEFGEPETEPITRLDGKPLDSCVPPYAVLPLYLGKKAQDFTEEDAKGLILSDFGEAFIPATEQRLGRDCHIPVAKRPPEAMFEPDQPLSHASDIWSLGTALWELVGMKYIFSECEPEEVVVAQQMDVLGSEDFPPAWRKEWEAAEDSAAEQTLPRRPLGEREIWPPLEEAFEAFVQKYRRKRESAGVFGEDETRAFLDLMRAMLRFRPEDRLPINQVLESEWISKWALPAYIASQP
ncbi:hypothetical protein G7054_g12665 [Neopestalotiopsis clavispora]|nr:hypothetical protein G7054_g12665 [Neopestalotiopsis clavispora]